MVYCLELPPLIKDICEKLNAGGFKAYVVGGALRDMILDRKNFDYDITTDALPHDIASLFPDAIPYGNFGTMLVLRKKSDRLIDSGNQEFQKNEGLEPGFKNHTDNLIKIEITPFRDDAPGRKPYYTFGGTIYTDLARRDFTINSIALDPVSGEFIDPFGGVKDIKAKIIRCTGSTQRIWEDPLRAMRAARFQAQLGFSIEPSTLYTLKARAPELADISRERIRDELSKLVTGDYAFDGLVTLVITGLMDYVIPELMEGMGMTHFNKPVDVLEHNLAACRVIRNTLPLRLTALLHDVAKPRTAFHGEKGLEFPKHHVASANLAEKILARLRFDKKTIKKVALLIKYHMFHYTQESPISDARRLISKVGWENIYDLIDIRVADRLASGFEMAIGKGLKKLLADLEMLKTEHSDYRVKDLAVDGTDISRELGIPPGKKIGDILNYLLEKVIEDPNINNRETLLKIARNNL
ncbi:MAG: CCA tRNA nucleotidyltransferase [Tepidanaerobacteraceae bacterium]|nr:CCA tRNA nucleotidyltransferase [Tepidanaerobacteraceae bacterium]